MNAVSLLKNQFAADKLKQTIESKDELRDYLFPDFIQKLNVEETYKTQEVSKMLGKSDANLRYYLRELDYYLEPLKNGRSYRLTYKSVFKLHMVVILVNNGYGLDDILVKLGMKVETAENTKSPSGTGKYDEDTVEQILYSFKQQLDHTKEAHKEMASHMDRRFTLYEKSSQLQAKDYEMRLIDEKMDLMELKLLHHQQEKQRHKQNVLLLKEEKNAGWLTGLLKLFKVEDDDEIVKKYEKVIEESQNIEEDSTEIKLKENLQELKNMKMSFEKEKTLLVEEMERLRVKLEEEGNQTLLESAERNI